MSAVVMERRGGLRILGSGGGGKKGRGGARSPVEQPDSLHNTSYAALLDVICNGEAYGPVHRDAPLRDVYLDGTPIQNEDGSLNFRDVQVEVRYGTQDQEHIPGFPASSSVKSVGVEVKTTTPWVQQITNPDLSAVRVSLHWPHLMRTVEKGKKAGDRVGFKVEYAIDLAVAGGSFAEVVRSAVDGKTVNGYTRTHRIDLPASTSGWRVRVRRITPEANSTAIQDKAIIQSYAEVIDGKFRYPMTALLGIKVDAEQFRAIPARAYHWRGQIVRVPSNYDSIARTYTGVWDGTFKRAWSNNPAWVYYDILLNKLYGLGSRVDASMIDRYALYQIGVYCDQSVSDGQGGQEPRFVCNTYIQSKADALRVLNDLTSVFRGMAYWASGQVVAVADMPTDPVYTYTNANVIDGRFEYTGADITTRKTVALVSWNDPSDFYRAKVEVVNDDDGIRRYGIRKTEITAFGCTSRGQAQRVGLYHLYTSRMETGGIAFSVGLDGVIPQPGSIIKIADRNRAGRHMGGRIARVASRRITLDRNTVVKVGDKLTVNLPTGKTQTRTVSAVAGRVVTVSRTFSPIPVAGAVWAIEADDLVAQHARVISIKERDGIVFEVAAVAHHPGKFDAIDTGVRLDPLPVSVVPPRVQMAPAEVLITEHFTIDQGIARPYAEIFWSKAEHAVAYDVQWRRDNGDWITVPRTGTRLVEIPNIYAGQHIARVRAVNALDVPSQWTYSSSTSLNGKTTPPPVAAFLRAAPLSQGVRLTWGFPSKGVEDVQRTELWMSMTPHRTNATKLSDLAQPQATYDHIGLDPFKSFYYWVRFVDRSGNKGEFYPKGDGVLGEPDTLKIDADTIVGDMIKDGALTITKFADSIKPPLVVKTLPSKGKEGDIVYLIGDGKLYTWTKGKWDSTVKIGAGAVTATELAANAVIAGKVAAGAIGTKEISAGAVTTPKLTITGSNLIPNGDFATGDFTNWARYTASTRSSVVAYDAASTKPTLNAMPARYACRFVGSDAAPIIAVFSHESPYTGSGWDKDGFEVKEGETYYVSIDVNRSDVAPWTRFYVQAYYRTRAGTNKSGQFAIDITKTEDISTKEYTALQGKFTVPGDALRCRLFVRVNGLTSGYIYWTNLRCIRMMSSQLIVDGSVKAQHVEANSITGKHVNAASIATALGTIKTAYIGMANIKGALQSDNFVSNQQGWRINKNGAIQINGSGGAGRLVISNNRLEVYDSNNKLRVRLGLW